MRYLFLIGIIIFILTQAVFDYCLIKSQTNDAILFYGGMYLAFVLMIINEILRTRNTYLTLIYGSIAAYFVYDIGFSLTLINKEYEEYEAAFINQHIPSYEFVIYLSIAMILIHTIFTKWIRY